MNKFFVIDSVLSRDDYIKIEFSLDEFNWLACLKSEFQYLDHSIISVEVDEDSGEIFQDFVYLSGVLLISDRLKNLFDSLGIDYLFYKKVLLTKKNIGREEDYWLTVPERIDCLDKENSEINARRKAKSIKIEEDKTGRYEIFKLAGVVNPEIIISERIATALRDSFRKELLLRYVTVILQVFIFTVLMMRNDAMSLSPMDIVKQTGTTIIFEEFDSNKPDLITLLTKDEDELPIEKFRNLIMGEDSELVVKSFSEFEEKFSPIIYETVVMEDGEPKFLYKLDKPKGECTQIKLKDHVFYKMIKNILDGKSHSDNGNLDFNYDEFKKALSPKESLEECKKIRKRLLANTKEYIQLVESGKPNSVEKKRLEKNIGYRAKWQTDNSQRRKNCGRV